MASVHCPSSKTYHLFTHLLLLTCDGRMAYSGPAQEALDYVQTTFHKEVTNPPTHPPRLVVRRSI